MIRQGSRHPWASAQGRSQPSFNKAPCANTTPGLAAHSFVLAQTIEELSIPRDLTAVCLGESTYARCGVVVNTTPAEAEWRGRLTLEISNTAPVPLILYPGEGIAQMLFWRAAEACEVSYADRRGRYQDQRRVTPPLVRSTIVRE